jgi:hypothetical protein
VTWLRRLFCRHEHVVLVKTYSEPRRVQMEPVEGTTAAVLAIMRMNERISSGCTDVLVRCAKCGDCENYTLLGKES